MIYIFSQSSFRTKITIITHNKKNIEGYIETKKEKERNLVELIQVKLALFLRPSHTQSFFSFSCSFLRFLSIS